MTHIGELLRVQTDQREALTDTDIDFDTRQPAPSTMPWDAGTNDAGQQLPEYICFALPNAHVFATELLPPRYRPNLT